MTYNLRIVDLPADERPRERLMAHGAHYLSTAELIAILLGTGQGKGKLSAVGLGQYLLNQLSQHQREPLGILRNISIQELTEIHGIGPAKATTILAAIELGKRVFQSRPPELAMIDDPRKAADALSHDLMWKVEERFAILLLDTKNRLLGTQLLTIGTATETLAHPRDIFRSILRQGATRVIIAHNHPSGNLEPSPEDIELTAQLLQGAQLICVPILDHLILGNGDYQSLRQITPLWQDYPQGD